MKKAYAVFLLFALMLCACSNDPSDASLFTDSVASEDFSKTIASYEYETRLTANPKIHRSLLSENEQEFYNRYLPRILAFKQFSVDFRTDGITYEEFLNVNNAIMADYPETWLYYSHSYEYDPASCDSEGNPSVFYGSSACYFNLRFTTENIANFDDDEVSRYLNELYLKCDSVIAEMPEALSLREKYTWIAERVCEMTEYSEEFDYLYADGPLLYGKGMCQSYSFAYQLLCQIAELWCITCDGEFNGISHTWNVIMLDDGLTYYMDLTRADGVPDNDCYFMSSEQCSKAGYTVGAGEWLADGIGDNDSSHENN